MAARKRFTREEIIGKLREAEVALAAGKTVTELCRKLGVTLSIGR
jgi:putative transposase